VGQRGHSKSRGLYFVLCKKEAKIINCEQDLLYTAQYCQQFVSDRIHVWFVRGRWCNVIVLNVHVPSEEKSDDSKTVFIRN